MPSNKVSAGKRIGKQGSSTPTTPADVIEKAFTLNSESNECLRTGKSNEAIKKLAQAIKLYPHPALFCNRAGLYGAIGKYNDSINDCRAAIKLDPKCAEAYGSMGYTFSSQKRYKKAIDAYKKATEFNPENEEFTRELALLEEKLKYTQQEPSPPSAEVIAKANALKEEGNEFMKASKFKEAIEKYSEAIAMKRDPVYLCNRAAAYCGIGQYWEAQNDGLEAISFDDKYAKAYGRIAFSASCLGRHFFAAQFYQKALELDPDNKNYKESLAIAQLKHHQADHRT